MCDICAIFPNQKFRNIHISFLRRPYLPVQNRLWRRRRYAFYLTKNISGKKSEIPKQEKEGATIQILALDYRICGSNFAAGRSDGSILVYDDETKKTIACYSGNSPAHAGHHNRVFAVKYLPDHHDTILTAGWDGNCFIWDLRERRCVDYFTCGKVSGDCIDYRSGNILIGYFF